MASIVAVQGIGQQVRGPHLLANMWLPALRDGITLAGHPVPEPEAVGFAFYGDLFRSVGTKAVGESPYTAADVQEEFEQEMLEAWSRAAAATDPGVPGPDADTKLRTASAVQRALNALSCSRFFAGVAEQALIGSLNTPTGVRYLAG